MKMNFFRHTVFVRFRSITRSIRIRSLPAVRSIASSTCLMKAIQACLAATPIGADRFGSQLSYLIVESLLRYYHFYGDSLFVECPTGSGNMMNLEQVSQINRSPESPTIFLPDELMAFASTIRSNQNMQTVPTGRILFCFMRVSTWRHEEA